MLITQHFVSHAVQPTVTTIINQEFSSMSMYDITAEKSKTMSLMTSSLNEDYTSAYIIDRSKTIIFKSSSSQNEDATCTVVLFPLSKQNCSDNHNTSTDVLPMRAAIGVGIAFDYSILYAI